MSGSRQAHLQDLIARVAQGDRLAFDSLYQTTSAKLNSICLSVLRDRREAEEVLEQAYIRIWKTAKGFADSGLLPRTWLSITARDLAIHRLRQRDNLALADSVPAWALSDPVAAVRHAYLQGLDATGFAQRAGLSAESARQRLHEGLAGMAAEFDGPDDALAAELALGLTDSKADAGRPSTDPAFAHRLRNWQERLALMMEDLTPVMAPARARQRIRESLGHSLAPLSVDPLERSPWWRGWGATLAAVLIAAAGLYLWMT